MYPRTNRQRADNDECFQVSITGFSRGRWSTVMEVLHEWISSQEDAKRKIAMEGVVRALESHVVDDSDGYQLGNTYMATTQIDKPLTAWEVEALKNARARRAAEIKAMKEFEKQFKLAKKNKGRESKAAKTQIEPSLPVRTVVHQ